MIASASPVVAGSPLPEPPTGWRSSAVCLGLDAEIFFPTTGESLGDALAVCSSCPVLAACTVAGLDERYGVFGGLSEKRRTELRRSLGLPRLRPYHPPLSYRPPPPPLPVAWARPPTRARASTRRPTDATQDARMRDRAADAAIGE